MSSNPIAPPPTTSQVGFTLNRISNPAEINPIPMVGKSTKEARPSCHVTAAIKPSEATLTPSSTLPTNGFGKGAEPHISPRQSRHNDHGGNDETEAADDQAYP